MLDALTVGLYAAIGMTKAIGIGLPLLPGMFVGVTAAVGGSALRDMLLAMPVAMLKVGTLYAVAAIAGTIALAASLACGAHVHVAGGCVRPSHHRGANVRGAVRLVTSRATFVDSESTRKLEVTRRHDVVDEVAIPGLPGTMPEVLVVVSGPVSYRQPS